MTIAPIDIRLYRRPIGISIPESAMPQSSALVPQPHCILCERYVHYTPHAVGFIHAGWPVMKESLFVVCLGCADSDEALELKIAAKVSEQPAVAAAE